jgi:hypothetical protein
MLQKRRRGTLGMEKDERVGIRDQGDMWSKKQKRKSHERLRNYWCGGTCLKSLKRQRQED